MRINTHLLITAVLMAPTLSTFGQPSFPVQPADQTVNQSFNVSLRGVAQRTAPLNSQWSFQSNAIPWAAMLDPASLTAADVGMPAYAGTTLATNGAVEITAGGTGIGPKTDQFHFAAAALTNDFDLKFRVSALANADVFTKAGLMVRESLEANAPFAGVFTTPTAAGPHFQSRVSAGSAAAQSGLFPPNVPFAWLRLQRVGDLFTGFASYDGMHWSVLGSNTVVLANVRVGFAVTSHNTNQATHALFTDLADVGAADSIVSFAAALEPPGPTSRRAAIVVSEVMYHPAPRADGRNGEFVEIYNSQPFYEDISAWRVAGDYDFTFPTNTVIPSGGFLLVAPNPADITAIYGLTNVVGGFTNALSHSNGKVQLLSDRGAVFYDLSYYDKAPWPLAADGSGHSLALVRPSWGEADARAWAASAHPGGSPGAWEFTDADPRRRVVLNELLARAAAGGPEAFVELHNHGNDPVDISGCRLGYDSLVPAYVFPASTSLPARGFLAVTAAQLGFALRVDAETLFFRAPTNASDGGPVLDAVRFEPSAAGVSRGRSAGGAAEVYALQATTPGAANTLPRASEVVLNEIMYAPLSGDKDLQYVELFNPGVTAVNLGGWSFTDGIGFVFPSGTTLAPGAYLVIARDAAKLRAVYTNLTAVTCLGNFSGSLSGRGERVVLVRPETVPIVGGATRTLQVPVDEVTYATGGQWGYWSDGGGSSLELTDARADRRSGANWADSDETAKARWTTIEATGVIDNSGGTADSLHLGLLGEGEALIDDIEVIGPTGTNLVAFADFESAPGSNFQVLGNHIRSAIKDGSGVGGSRSLHIRASGNVDTGANRIRLELARNLNDGDIATIRAQVRWLKGWPEILLRFHGNGLEAVGRLDIADSLGTPGAANSRAVANAGPALAQVEHFPVLPGAGEAVVVSLRATDPDRVGSLTLNWRADPATEYAGVPLLDDGTGGDGVAGDGVFSATVPGQSSGVMVAFYVSATDAAATPATSVFPAGAPAHECLIRFGEPASVNAFGTYRLWLSKKAVSAWSTRQNLSNEPVEGTLVYGDFRVIHGAGYRYSGSPFHQQFVSPTANCHYVWKLPGDDRLLGTDNFNKIHATGQEPFDDDSLQREQIVFWMGRQLGLPWLYRRYVNVYVNGSKRQRLMEDTQVPGGDMVNSYFPDDADGELFKINAWFEFATGTGTSLPFSIVSWANLNDYTTTGGLKKTARYRWTWQPRAAKGTANDFSSLFALVEVTKIASEPAYISALEAEVDMEQWLRTFALNHAVGNWDSFGNENGSNMYGYKPERGPWRLFMWDANTVLGNGGSDGPSGDNLFQYFGSDVPLGRIYSTPKFRRAYLRFLKEIANGPMQAARVAALIDAKVAAFQAAGATASTASSVKSWIKSRVTYLNAQVDKVTAPFAAAADGVIGGATSQNFITLSGTAPIEVRDLRLNGALVPVTWTSETSWTVAVVLGPAANRFTVEGLDGQGTVFAGASETVTVEFTGTFERAVDKLVFSEISYRPATPGAEFVELHNASASNGFDLSGWHVVGLGYTFPAGTLLAPGQRFVLAADRAAFNCAYDPSRAVLNDIFPGTLSPDGETLRLVKPGAAPVPDEVGTAVTYSPLAPWPAFAAGSGSSLQLIDPSRGQDERVGNWAALPLRDPNAVNWEFAVATGVAGANGTVQLYLTGFPPVTNPLDAVGTFFGAITFNGLPFLFGVRFHRDQGLLAADFLYDPDYPTHSEPLFNVSQAGLDLRFAFDDGSRFTCKLAADGSKITGSYVAGSSSPFSFTRLNPGGDVMVDNVALVLGEIAENGPNLLVDGGFESALSGPWAANGAHGASEITTARAHRGGSALRLRATAGGTGADGNAVIQSVTGLAPGQTCTLSYWYLGTTKGASIVARLGDGAVQAPVKLEPPVDPHDEFTPGYANTAAAVLPEFPDLWLNEVLPDPVTGAPYAELFNHGTNALDLTDVFLSDSGTNLLRDALPRGRTLVPGQFLVVILDGAGVIDDFSIHTSFRPDARRGSLFLTRVKDGQTNVLDHVRWDNLSRGRSVGHFPDASPHGDHVFATPTPGAPNSLVVPALPVLINEWLASNSRDPDPASSPADPEFDDWFEIYNPNAVPADLSGYFLSDTLTNRTQFTIPAGRVVPARGYLLVWADSQPKQNTATNADLHVNFKLSVAGEAIALFAPDGMLVDAVTFGPQIAEVSEGRAADGGSGAFVRFIAPTPRGANLAVSPPAAPVMSAPAFNAGEEWVLTFTTEAGRRYQVRSKDALDEPSWQDYGSPLTADSGTTVLTDSRPLAAARFYQVVVVE